MSQLTHVSLNKEAWEKILAKQGQGHLKPAPISDPHILEEIRKYMKGKKS
jgi:hypothetical protein